MTIVGDRGRGEAENKVEERGALRIPPIVSVVLNTSERARECELFGKECVANEEESRIGKCWGS